MSDPKNFPFSQRYGLKPIPPQLEAGVVSDELRRLLWHAIYSDVDHCMNGGYGRAYIEGHWERILRDYYVRKLKQMPNMFSASDDHVQSLSRILEKADLPFLFDTIEFFLQHRSFPAALKSAVATAFVDARAAYRVVDATQIVPIASEAEGDALQRALADVDAVGAAGAKAHLLKAGGELRSGKWADAVRESIHAVESIAVQLAPGASTLGDALATLEKSGHLHGALKKGLSALYGYASDEKGVRHALVLQETANVDEADALFMFGACAAFISYLISQGRCAGLLKA